jgi:hypothetical protein
MLVVHHIGLAIDSEELTQGASQITCLYDMDIPRPDNFNETYLYEGATLSIKTGGS